MFNRPLRVGIIGCGRVVQTTHASALASIPSILVVSACDIDEPSRDAVAARFGVEHRCDSWEEVVSRADIDAVLVATNDHVAPALAAVRAGKHLLVEKPLCFDIDDAKEIVHAAEDAGVVAMVGYMKRYDWCLERASELIAHLPRTCMARVHDFACAFDKTEYLFDVVPRRAQSQQDSAHSAVELLLMFASHDLSIIRGAIGHPEEVVHVSATAPHTLSVELRCTNGRTCMLDVSLDTRYEWFDETLVVYGEEEEVGVRFADPFVPYGRSTLWRRRRDGHAVHEEFTTGPHDDGFRREWLHFAQCISAGQRPRTPLRDGLADVELAHEIAARWHVDTILEENTQ